jgi:acyl-CoA synthetase (AMP-forming)/AMP-acid ligase II
MGPAFYVMAILGCGEADAPCEPVNTLATRYESAEACEAATADALQRSSDALFPVVIAQCRKAGTEISQKVWADEVKLPEASGQPRVRRAAYAARGSRS